MIFAASNIAWRPEERHEAYAAMAELGFSGLEIAPGMFFHDSVDAFNPSPADLRRALGEVASEGLRLVSMQSILFAVEGAEVFGDHSAQDRFRNGMQQAIDLAGRCGIPNLVFGSPAQRRIPAGRAPGEAVAEAVDTFRSIGERAATSGVVIAIEANPAVYGTNFLNTLNEAVDFVLEVSHPAIRLVLDLGAQAMNGEASVTAARVPDIIRLLNHVHVSEARLAPAPADPEGLAQILAALSSASYDGAVSIEMKRPNGGIAETRRCFEAFVLANKLRGRV